MQPMAVPKCKVSKARRNSRAANWKLETPNLVECPQCHELKLSHQACKNADITTASKLLLLKTRATKSSSVS